jgi:hypothetical protein
MYVRFISIAMAAAATCAALWSVLFYLELGTHTEASRSRCENVRLKRDLVREVASPKLAVIAGSSTARGVNAQILSQVTGRQAVNFGLFAGIGPDVVLDEARRILQPGDTALLALEYNHFVSEGPSADAIDYVLGCGGEFFRRLPLVEKARYVFSLPLSRVYRSLAAPPARASKGSERSNLTSLGDMKLVPKVFPPISEQDRTRMSLYRPMPIAMNPDSHGARTIAAFIAWAREHRINVIATWPNTIYFPEYAHASGFGDVRRFYAELGVDMVGDRASSLLPLAMFYNTQYHLNIEGIRIRSRRLADDLLEYFASRARESPDLRAANQR